MPRIPENLIRSVVYLYPTEGNARNSEHVGGTAFIVGIHIAPDLPQTHWHAYAVTNRHIIEDGNSPVIRVNHHSGRWDVLAKTSTDWTVHPDWDDVAICPLSIGEDTHKVSLTPLDFFVTQDDIRENIIGIGDEVFMIGRLIGHAGTLENLPVVRFGNIAMLPIEPVKNKRGIKQESFLVETRSDSGFSGSPVFAYQPTFLTGKVAPDSSILWSVFSATRVRLLGLDWGHIEIKARLQDQSGLVEPPNYVEINSGMATVLPAWKITELLNLDVFQQERKEAEDMMRKEIDDSPASFDLATREETEEETSEEFSRFRDLARKGMQTPKSDVDMPQRSKKRK